MLDKFLSFLAFSLYFGAKLFWFLLIAASLIGGGLAVGAVLSKLAPSIDLGTGTLIGLFSLVVSFKCYRASVKFINDTVNEKQKEYDTKKAFASVERHLRSNPRIRKTKE
jgi:ABC-type xylose transport system permease subunit